MSRLRGKNISRRDFNRIAGCLLASPLLSIPSYSFLGKLKKDIEKIPVGDSTVKILTFKKGNSDVIYFAPHGDEPNAFKAGLKTVNKQGGKFIYLPNKGVRVVVFDLGNKRHAFDANRIFTEDGIKQTLEKWGKIRNDCDGYTEEAHEAVRPFAEHLKKKLDSKVIVGVHGNTDGKWVTEEEMNATDSYWNPDMDKDDFFLVINEKHFEYLKEKKLNVILESKDADDDGSLSVYCRQNCIPYVNVEAQYEHLKEQLVMLKELREMIKEFYDI